MHIRVDLMKHELPMFHTENDLLQNLVVTSRRVRERNLEKVFLNRGNGDVCTAMKH